MIAPAGRVFGQTVDFGAPLRVRLFAALALEKLTVNGVTIDAHAATVTNAGGTTSLGTGVLEFTGTPSLEVVATAADGSATARTYSGVVFVALRQSELLVVNQVDVETYVASVMSAEVSPGWALESLRAQAMAVRTYAARSRLSNALREYDLKDDTSSQVYRGIGGVASSLVSAARDTAGRIVWFGGEPASVFYSSSCGGHTASSEELTGLAAPSYLLGISDVDRSGHAYCGGAPYFRWTNSVGADAMARVVGLPSNELTAIQVTERWPDGRVKSVLASGSLVSVSMSGRDFYQRALGILGYKVIPSAMFDVNRIGTDFQLEGHGVGHGVGMCQWGARGRAQAGITAEQILQAYFPGTTIQAV